MMTGFRLTLLCLVLLRANRGHTYGNGLVNHCKARAVRNMEAVQKRFFETMSSSCLYWQSEYERFVLPNRQIRKIGLCIRTAPKRNLAARGA